MQESKPPFFTPRLFGLVLQNRSDEFEKSPFIRRKNCAESGG